MAGYSAGQIEIEVIATDATQGTLRAVEANLAAFEGRASSVLNRLGSMSAATAGIVAVGAAFSTMARQAAQVQQNVANLNAALRATPQQLAAIRQTGLDLSRNSPFTDAQILLAQRSLARAGTSPQQLASQSLNQNITNLASATFSQPVQAADAYIAAQKTFQRSNADSADTVDILAQAVDSSVGSLTDFQSAFKQIGPVSNSAGESLRDTATAIADLQNAGLRGDTGTAIKTVLTRIENPTRQAKAEIDALGLSFYTASGQLKDFAGIADELRLKTSGLGDEQRNQALTQIFGTRGVRVADVFAEEGGQGIRDTAQHMMEVGTAGEIAAEKMDTLEGAAHKLSSSINVLAVQGGQALIPTLRAMTDTATAAANALSKLGAGTGGIGSSTILGGVAIGAEVLAGRQIGNLIQKRRDEAAAPGIKAAQAEAQQQKALGDIIFANSQAQRRFDDQVQGTGQSAAVAQQRQQEQEMLAIREREVQVTQELADAQTRLDAQIAGSGVAGSAEQARVQALREEVALLGQQDVLQANIAASSAKASAAGLANLNATKTQLAQQLEYYQAIEYAGQASGGKYGMSAQQVRNQGYASEQLRLLESGGNVSEQLALKTLQERYEEMNAERFAKGQFAPKPPTADLFVGRSAGYSEDLSVYTEYETKKTALAGEQAAVRTRIANEESAATIAASEKVLASTIAANDAKMSNLLGGVAGKGTSAGSAVSVPVTLAPTAGAITTTGLVATTRGKIGSTLAAAGALIGEVALPLTIALTVKQMIVDPAVDALAKKRAQAAAGSLDENLYGADPAQVQKQAESDLQRYQQALQAAQNRGIGAGAKVVSLVGGSYTVGRYFTQRTDDEIAQLKQNISDAQTRLDQAKQTQQNSPGNFVNDEITQIQDLTQQIQAGKLTADQAMSSFQLVADKGADPYGESLVNISDAALKAGLSQKQLNDLLAQASTLFKQSEQQTRDAAVAQADLARAQGQQADQLREIGVPESTIQQAVFHKGTAEEESNAKSVIQFYQDAKKAADEAKAAADAFSASLANTRAQQSQQVSALLSSTQQQGGSLAQGIDLSKGTDSLAGAADGLRSVKERLDALGQSSPAINRLSDLATTFQNIAKAEDQATTEMQGYLLLIGNSDRYLGQIGQVQTKFDQLVDAAYGARLRGTATDAQNTLINNRGKIQGTLDTQSSSLLATETEDFLGEVQHLPDWDKLSQSVRDAIEKGGGSAQVIIDVRSNIDDIKNQLTEIERHQWQATIQAYVTPQPGGVDYNIGANKGAAASGYNEPYTGLPAPSGPPLISGPASGLGLGGAGSSLGYSTLSQSQYSQIVTQGPLANPTAYAQIVKAAQDAGVDPRLLLSTMKFEGQFGTDPQLAAASANNLSGIKYIGQRSAYDSGIAADNGGTYAGFKSLPEFFTALARNLTTDPYDKAFASGDYKQIATTYVAGNRPPTADQSRNIDARVDYYNSLTQQFPGTAGGGSAATGNVQSAVDATRQKIVQKALSQVGIDELANYCEQFVEETVQSITGQRGATGKQEQSASTALTDARSMGLVTKDPQPGDLVYYDTGGAGHVAIYAGDGKQISTWDQGDINNPANRKVHVESVGSGAQYVRIPGLSVGTQTVDEFGHPLGSPNSLNGLTGNNPTPITMLSAASANVLSKVINDLGSTASAQLTKFFSPIYSAQQVLVTQQHQGGDPTRKIGPEEQLAVNQESIQGTTDAMIALGRAQLDLATGAGDWHAELAKVVDIMGPVGTLLVTQFQIEEQIAQTTAKVKTDQAAIVSIEQSHTQTLNARHQRDVGQADTYATQQYNQQVAQQVQQLGRTTAQWGREDEKRSVDFAFSQWIKSANDQFTTGKNALDDAARTANRLAQDTSDASARTHTLNDRTLEDRVEAAQKLADQVKAGNSALDIAYGARAKVAGGDVGDKRLASEQLAIQREYEEKQARAGADQLTALKDAQTAENRRYEDEQYNIATTKKASDRYFEDQATALDRWHQQTIDNLQSAQEKQDRYYDDVERGISRSQTIEDANREYNDRATAFSHDQAMRQQQEQDYQADQTYQTQLAAAQTTLATDQQHLSDLQQQSQEVQGVLTLWSQVAQVAGSAANSLLSSLGAGFGTSSATASDNPTGLGNLPGHASGIVNSASGHWAIIGERGPEAMFVPGGATILPNSALHAATASSMGTATPQVQQVVNLNLGDVLTNLSAADRADINAFITQKINKAMAQPAGGAAARTGRARSVA